MYYIQERRRTVIEALNLSPMWAWVRNCFALVRSFSVREMDRRRRATTPWIWQLRTWANYNTKTGRVRERDEREREKKSVSELIFIISREIRKICVSSALPISPAGFYGLSRLVRACVGGSMSRQRSAAAGSRDRDSLYILDLNQSIWCLFFSSHSPHALNLINEEGFFKT